MKSVIPVAKTLIPKGIAKTILKSLNVYLPLNLSKDLSIQVPIVGGIGLSLVSYNPDWFVFLFERLLDLKKGAFYDIGTNIGQTLISMYAAKQDIKYIGFEPNPLCVSYMNKLIEANQFFQNNCIVIPVALSDQATVIQLYIPQVDEISGSSTIVKDLRPERDLLETVIPAFTLEEVCKNLNLVQPSTIKIDVEGAELKVLQGAYPVIARHRPLILCEVLFRDQKASPTSKAEQNAAIMGILNQLNYVVFQLIKTPDLRCISSAVKITEFSNEVWSLENKWLCDYLFIPQEDEKLVMDKLAL